MGIADGSRAMAERFLVMPRGRAVRVRAALLGTLPGSRGGFARKRKLCKQSWFCA